MKKILLSLSVLAVTSAAFAAPSVSGVVSHIRADGSYRVKYVLSGDPAVVTLALYDKSTDAKIDESLYTNLVGDVNCYVTPGTKTITFKPNSTGVSAANLEARVRAWATNCPPNYLVIDLKKAVNRYYVNTNAMPFKVTDFAAKTDYLVMRKIPAANREFRMGSFESEGVSGSRSLQNAVREDHHYVLLTEDYYLGIYPVTHGQQKTAVWDGASFGPWASGKTATYGASCSEDMPMAPIQFVSLRAWMHNSPSCTGDCGVQTKTWPENGHDIDAEGASKCVKTGGTYTPYLRKWRKNFHLQFDLPTEAQWEFACRAGTDFVHYGEPLTADYSKVPANLDDYAWHVGNSTNATLGMNFLKPVGLKKPNAFGLYDMLGNVWEWCLDNVEDKWATSTTVTDPVGPAANNDRNRQKILRGGSFCSLADSCRPAARIKGSTPNLDNAGCSAPAVTSAESSKWHYGYRLCVPARVFR